MRVLLKMRVLLRSKAALSTTLMVSILCLGLVWRSSASAQSATDIVLYATDATTRAGNWEVVADSTAAGGARLHNPDAGAAKVNTPAASPSDYFELTFTAQAATAYRLWVRGKADGDSPYNDSIYVQFSGSVDAGGAAAFRIGAADATTINIEDGLSTGLSGWGWQDNGWGIGVMGQLIYFQASGSQTMRVQVREDGLSIDQIVLSPLTYVAASPGTLKNDHVILPKTAPPPPPPAPTSTSDVVIWAADVSSSRIFGNWATVFNGSAAGSTALRNPDAGAAKIATPLASPSSYFEMTFTAQAGSAYRLWIRGQADGDSPYNDSVYVQFSGSADASGSAAYRIGTTDAAAINLEDDLGRGLSGWGWQDNGWGVGVMGPLIYFQSSGTQTIRVQPREDGLSIDQIVLSPQRYLSNSPGALKNDSVILPSTMSVTPTVNQPPSVTISASPALGTYPLSVSFSSNASDPDGAIISYAWSFGDGNTSSSVAPSNLYTSAGAFTARLTVTDNSGATATASMPVTVNAPSVLGSTLIKWLDWNIQMGNGTDNAYNLDRTATYIANMQPDLVTLCEVQRYSGDDQAQRLSDLLRQKTGFTWYFFFTPKFSGCTEGNLILSKFPIVSTASLFLSVQRSVAKASIVVNSRTLNVFATHLDPDSASSRTQEITELRNWILGFGGNSIVAGDFNAWPGASEIAGMTSWCSDAWADASNNGTATAYPDNPVDAVNTRTRRARIDYVFYSRSAPNLVLRAAQVPDLRDLSKSPAELLGTADDKGVRPSDHNMSMITFEVR